jgi:hypothetical protein
VFEKTTIDVTYTEVVHRMLKHNAPVCTASSAALFLYPLFSYPALFSKLPSDSYALGISLQIVEGRSAIERSTAVNNRHAQDDTSLIRMPLESRRALIKRLADLGLLESSVLLKFEHAPKPFQTLDPDEVHASRVHKRSGDSSRQHDEMRCRCPGLQ